jgi:GMP synthase-like glutamine amidotransferase
MQPTQSPLYVVQHTSGEFLGLLEDHLEGRGIRFLYFRPFTAGGGLPPSIDYAKGLVLLGGGPWGTTEGRKLPTLFDELALARRCLELDKPVIGIGVGAQVLAIAAGGGSEPADLRFTVGTARRTRDDALNGFLPETYPLVVYMRDRPLPPADADVLAVDEAGAPALFQVGARGFGFTGHPGAKRAMAEDLLMEFEEAPADAAAALEALGAAQSRIEDALVPIMTGIVQRTGLMRTDA